MKRLLIVEDDKNLNRGLSLALEDKFQISSAFLLEEARELWKNSQMILLDMNLPDGDGLEFIEEIRQTSDIPILVLSAKDMEMDVVTAIQTGADDYITKPFSFGILQAKLERMGRKISRIDLGTYRFLDYIFDFVKRDFRQGYNQIHLTTTEEKILYYLIQAKGTTVSREILLEKIWDLQGDFVDPNTLSVNVNRLRSKLGDPSPIETVYGVGYRWKY